jgi:hypothetical protein
MIDELRDLTRGGGAGRLALSYVALTGMLGAAVLLMKLVVALQLLGGMGSADF